MNKNDKSEVTRLGLLNEFKEQVENNLLSYSENYLKVKPKKGFENEWELENKKLKLIYNMIHEEQNKSLKKDNVR